MRLFTIIPIAVLALSFTVGAAAIVAEGKARAARAQADPPGGMDILHAYACGPGETKEILVRGVEDGFSPAGEEPGFIRAGRNSGLPPARQGAGQYDQVNADRHLLDSFRVTGTYSSGIFLFRARALGDNSNDGIGLGDLSVDKETGRLGPRGGIILANMAGDARWVTRGEIRHAALKDIFINRNYPTPPAGDGLSPERSYSLLSFLNEPAGPGWLDIVVQDDTAVDFVGLALCSPPPVKRGVTLTPYRPPALERPGIVNLACHPVRNGDHRCDPYVGDTPCSAALPVACLRPGDLPPPVDSDGSSLTLAWSGGTIAVTEPVAGERFRSVRDVETFCARHFGADWRVASINDGMRNQSVSGKGDAQTILGRVWVDIADQPHATCWDRE